MAIDGQTAEKLRGLLRELTPRARAMLLAELERGGAPLPASDMILRELRNAERPADAPPAPPAAPAAPAAPESAPPPPSPLEPDGQAARMFYAFVEPFFVDDAPEYVHHGRIARASGVPIWQWICRDLVPAEARTYSENVAKLSAGGQATNAFQERVAQLIEQALAATARDDKARRQLAHQIG